MIIIIDKNKSNRWYSFYIKSLIFDQKEYDYIFKYLDFKKINKSGFVHFDDYEIEKWFRKTHINSNWLNTIHNNSPLGYEYLQNNWGNGVFKLYVFYPDKKELKTVVNKVINIELIRGK